MKIRVAANSSFKDAEKSTLNLGICSVAYIFELNYRFYSNILLQTYAVALLEIYKARLVYLKMCLIKKQFGVYPKSGVKVCHYLFSLLCKKSNLNLSYILKNKANKIHNGTP